MDPLTYTLIITQLISTLTSPQMSFTTVVVPNFATEQACRQAGAALEVDARTLTATTKLRLSTSFVCAPNK